MPTLTKQQIEEAKKRGVSQEQIDKYMGISKKSPLEKIGSLVGADVVGKRIAGEISKFIPIPKVVAPVNFKGTQKEYQATQQEQYRQDVKKDMPTNAQTLAGVGKLGLTLGTLGTSGVATSLAGRVVEGGVLGATFQALDNIQNKRGIGEGLGTATVIGGGIPLVGTAVKKGLSKLFSGTAQKIEKSLVRPSKIDMEDGFKVENIKKYGITGNLTQKAQKVEQKLSDLTKQLKDKISSRSDAVIDLNDIADRTAKVIMSDKGKTFGSITSTQKAMKGLVDEIELYSKNGLVDLVEAQVIKQSAGKKGAWVYQFLDPDAKANEFVYSKFYRELRQEIEKKAPEGVREINKQIGELIPIMHAIIRRIPVAERNNTLSLTDIITGGFAIGNPKAIGLFALNRALKSGNVANFLSKTGEILEKTPKTNIGKRVFGR